MVSLHASHTISHRLWYQRNRSTYLPEKNPTDQRRLGVRGRERLMENDYVGSAELQGKRGKVGLMALCPDGEFIHL